MGMFDTLYINSSKLPVSVEEQELLKGKSFQTKDLDCYMAEVQITDEGRLIINDFEYEEVPKEERPYPDGEGIMALAGSLRKINERKRDMNYHGYVQFYTYVEDINDTLKEDIFYEFGALFIDGNLDKIIKLKEQL